MVLKKRYYGSSAYQISTIPDVPKSARGKRSFRKKAEDYQPCAFDLLATVAGKILLEGENSACSHDTVGTLDLGTTKENVKVEHEVNHKLPTSGSLTQQNNNDRIPVSEVNVRRLTADDWQDDSLVFSAATSESISCFAKFDKAHHDVIAAKPLTISNKTKGGCPLTADTEKWHALNNSFGSEKSDDFKGEAIKTLLQADCQTISNALDENVVEISSSVNPMDLGKPPSVSSDSSIVVPLFRNNSNSYLFQKDEDGMKVAVDKDDDENSSGCTNVSIPTNKATRPQQLGDRRMRKLLAPKYWKAPSPKFQAGQFFNCCKTPITSNVEAKSVLQNKKKCYTRQKIQRSFFKRRKLIKHNSGLKSLEANGLSTSISGGSPPYDSSKYHVKLRIKSFKVPEIFIDIPETATVASLKQTVMESVTAILGGGLRVGILLQGKKVRDDNETLHQAGISHIDELDSISFTLEPNPSNTLSTTSTENPNVFGVAYDGEPLARMTLFAPAPVEQEASDTIPRPVLTSCHESDHDSVHSSTNVSLPDKTESDSPVPVIPSLTAQMQSMFPLPKPRRLEIAQRRIRRPFSIIEVEALVQVVENLGTGRWRDVKLRAFDNAKHRTYVDLKDKWKTLVHTAKISPQQRRGEPLPQKLLDRVLAADTYWSQQQSKLQVRASSQVDP